MQEDDPIERPKPIEEEKREAPDTQEEKDYIERPNPIVKEYSENFSKKDNKKS